MSLGGGIEGGGNINTLGGVNIANPQDNQILIYVAATQTWVNGNNTPGAATLAGLTDVSLTAPTANDFLVYNGTFWVNLSPNNAIAALGLGTISTQDANNVAITGGTINGVDFTGQDWNGNTVTILEGGTGQTTKTTSFNALSPTTTKGDLIVNNGTNNIRLAVGTDNYVLTADSGQAGGVKWASTATLGGYNLVENEGTPLTARSTINFASTGIIAADDAVNSVTKITLDAAIEGWTGFNTNGVLVQTAADTFNARTITGTANQIAVNNGTGVAGNPTISIDGAYVGQTSITTLGTITTGVWDGTTIAIANGGTGQITKTLGFDALSPTTTKGDLIVNNGTNNVRIVVGTDGQVLQSDSTALTGVSWITNPTGAYNTVDNNGTPLTKRSILNFSGSGITAVDNAGATRTDVALAARLVDIAGLTPTANTIIYGNGTNFTNTSTATTNTYYVAKNGNDSTGDGSINFPYLTVSAAMTAIGNATSSAQFNDATQEYYVINIYPGTYTEAVTIPNRPLIQINFYASRIVGNVTQSFDGTLLGGAISTAKVIFQGNDIIGVHTGLSLAKTGVVGNVTLTRPAGAFNFNAYEFINTGVNGNIVADGAVAYTLLLYTDNTNVSGNITANQATININLYAEDCNIPGTTGIGGCSGPGTVTLRNIRNVAFSGVVTTGAASAAFNWDNVTFAAVANNFTGLTANIITDSASYQNYLTNVPTKGSETFTFRDSAKGINANYSPVNYTAVNTSVQGNLNGIDNAFASFIGGISWAVYTTNQTLAKNHGYFSNSATNLTFTLPVTAAVGDTYSISNMNTGNFIIAQNVNQSIKFGNLITTVGTGGSITSTNSGDGITIVCNVANIGFQVMPGCIGNLSII